MEEDNKSAGKPCEVAGAPAAHSGVSTQEAERDPREKVVTPERIIDQQRDLLTLVTNIQTAADAKASILRTEMEEARRLRFEQLQSDLKSSQEKYEETWSVIKQKMIPQELQEGLNKQQQLCDAIIEDKKKLINELQQALKTRDDSYIEDHKKFTQELDLMREMMDDQFKTLAKSYMEELANMERVYLQECEILLTKDETEWEQRVKELLEGELRRLMEKRNTVEEYEKVIHNIILENNAINYHEDEEAINAQAKAHIVKQDYVVYWLKIEEQQYLEGIHNYSLKTVKKRMKSVKKELKDLLAKSSSMQKQFTKKSRCLSEDYKRSAQRYERLQEKIKYFGANDVRKFKEMWLMLEGEVKPLVERALYNDSLICKEHLGLAWEQPPLPFMERSGWIQPQKRDPAVSQSFKTAQALQAHQRMVDAAVGPSLMAENESSNMEGMRVKSESGTDEEEEKLSNETLKKVMELFCNEAGFLVEDKILNLLEEEQTVVKLNTLLSACGVDEGDMSKLALFLLNYKYQPKGQDEAVGWIESGESNEVMDPNQLMPALKSFLEQLTRSRENSACQLSKLLHIETRNTSEDEAYWASMGNVISEDKMKLWDTAEKKLREYHAILTDISKLIPETQILEQQNKELRMLLQKTLTSRE